MTKERVTTAMRRAVAEMAVPGATWAVVSGARQVVEVGSAGPVRQNTMFRIASITKPIVAVLTLALVDDGVFDLDDAIDRWIPECADRKVLRRRGAELTATEPAARPTTIRDLLQMGLGLGWDMTAGPSDPLTAEIARLEISSAWEPPVLGPDRWAERAGSLPMAHQPGEGWLYQFSFDALTVLIERAMRRRLDLVLRERVLNRLDMGETGYSVELVDIERVTSTWFPNRRGAFVEVAPIGDPRLMDTPAFRSGATGIVSTIDDLAKFATMLLRGGRGPRGPVISAEAFTALTTDTLGDAARAMAGEFLAPGLGWGLGVAIDTEARYASSHPGRFGWDGGTGTSMWVDPAAGVAGVLLTRQGMGGTEPPAYLNAFWEAVHGA